MWGKRRESHFATHREEFLRAICDIFCANNNDIGFRKKCFRVNFIDIILQGSHPLSEMTKINSQYHTRLYKKYPEFPLGCFSSPLSPHPASYPVHIHFANLYICCGNPQMMPVMGNPLLRNNV
jgi:hypothetical protein